MLEVRHANQRGNGDHGWLRSRHTFSFASYYDPKQMGFSDLIVINDDHITPGQGFGTHPHRDMEIFTYVLDGSLEHKDTMGTGSIIVRGDIQLMSAGSGVAHSEYNASATDPVHLLQIWITPEKKGTPPRYQQRRFSDEEKRGKFRLVLSPSEEDGSLVIQQNARVYAGLFDADETASLAIDSERFAYVHVAGGNVRLNGLPLGEGDGVKVRNEKLLTFSDGKNAEVLVFDLLAKDAPSR